MAGDEKYERRGQLVPPDKDRLPRPWESQGRELAYPPKRTVWGNRLQKNRIESGEEVIAAASRLVDTLYHHEFVRARFRNVYYDIQRWLKNEQLKAEIEHEGLCIELQRVRRLRRQLEGEGEDEQDKYDKRLQDAKRKMEFEAEMKVLQGRNAFEVIGRLKEERERIRETLMRAASGELTEEQRLQLENLDDLFQKLIDEVR
jgi:hypothetical protein